jgi:hypothetical protein
MGLLFLFIGLIMSKAMTICVCFLPDTYLLDSMRGNACRLLPTQKCFGTVPPVFSNGRLLEKKKNYI